MAFILRNTKRAYSLVGFTCKMGRFTNRSKKIFFFDKPNIFTSKDFLVRSKVNLAQKEVVNNNYADLMDGNIFKLNESIKRKNVSLRFVQNFLKNVQEKGSITNYELIILLKSCTQVAFMSTNQERIRMAEEIWENAKSLGVNLNITHYNALLDVFLANNHVFSPSEFLQDLEGANLAPNIHTYRRLLKAYCQQGDLKGASDILTIMKKLEYKLNEIDFNSLILCYCNSGEIEKAEEVISVMESKNVEPSAQTYVNLLCGYAKHGLFEKLHDTLKDLPSKEIFLSDYDILEIFYALALNNHDESAEMVLQELPKSSALNEVLLKFTIRLFHKKLDSVALNLLELIENTSESKVSHFVSQYLLEYFVSYRTFPETLEMCSFLEKKGFARVPIAYSLKTIFLTKDEEFILKFLSFLSDNKIEVRKHYYWPGIIKASKKGNSYFLSYLKKLPKNVLNNMKTLSDYVFPNYEFGKDWKEDLKIFEEAGIRTALVTRAFIEMFLKNNQFDDFVYTVSSYPVYYIWMNHIFHLLSNVLHTDPEKTEQVVDAVYKFSHDFYNFKKNLSEPIDISQFFNGALNCLLKHKLKEETVVRLLEGMLEKKMRIPDSEAAAQVRHLYSSERVEELVEKLTKLDMEFEFNENLLSLKQLTSLSDFREPTESKTNLSSLMFTVSELLDSIIKERFDEALKICEQLYSRGKETSVRPDVQWKFRSCFLESARKGNPKLTEKLFEVGVSLGLLKSDDFVPVIRSLLISKNVPEAIDKYCEFVLNHGILTGCIELLSELVLKEDVEGCQKIVNLVTDVRNKNIGLSVLVCAFIKTNNFEKAKKVLETPGFTFSKKLALSFCLSNAKMKTSEFLEKVLELFEGLNYFREDWMYKILTEKYVKEKKVEKLKELWPKISENPNLDENFLNQFESFVKEPSVERLNVFDFITSENLKKSQDAKTADDRFEEDKTEKTSKESEKKIEVQTLVREGKISELATLVKNSSVSAELVTEMLFRDGKIDDYFKIVKFFVSENRTKKDIFILLPLKLMQFLQNDEDFTKYTSLAVECLQKEIVEPFVFCICACLVRPQKLEEALRLMEENSSSFDIKNIPLNKLYWVCKRTQVPYMEFAKTVLSDERLREKFSMKLPVLYVKVISRAFKEGDVKLAVDHLEIAKSNGELNKIQNTNWLNMIKQQLTYHNINFSLESSN